MDYVAPEECLLEEITPAADIFGLGVTLYELLTGKMPFPEKGMPNPIRRFRKRHGPFDDIGRPCRSGLEKLVLSCLARDPKARPNLAALLPSLHRYIGSGPRLWPPGFHPER